MKKIIVSALIAFLYGAVDGQSPVYSYTNSAPNSVPGNPGQPAELYPGTNPAGGENTKSTIVIPNPPGIITDSNNPAYQSNPNGYSPNQIRPYGTPTNSYNAYPGVSSPTNQVNRLYQDPMKSSKYPNSDPPVSQPDGSTGKYKKNHKISNGHNFATHHRHIKKAKKSSGKNSIEKKKESSTQ